MSNYHQPYHDNTDKQHARFHYSLIHKEARHYFFFFSQSIRSSTIFANRFQCQKRIYFTMALQRIIESHLSKQKLRVIFAKRNNPKYPTIYFSRPDGYKSYAHSYGPNKLFNGGNPSSNWRTSPLLSRGLVEQDTAGNEVGWD